MTYKFEKLEVWKLAMEFNALSYDIAEKLPESEKYNLNSQLRRASTSIALNIAEGSTGQSNAQQSRFLSFAIRSHVEVIACIRLIQRRDYIDPNSKLVKDFKQLGSTLFAKLNAFLKALT
ncbi:four helix bundle protein [Aliifodinibius salipaludis]|uniref:Four helix bundle protein n=1 Tax=Fodinibius salipaludis TaxID=2032627 RepID=A0A2A2G6F7_9BACT|nr:four helix bundle protein [Aliifodinibius salipaludis]PAU93211.1 four helix bundle protein [Aliifodinibius salipaludis]